MTGQIRIDEIQAMLGIDRAKALLIARATLFGLEPPNLDHLVVIDKFPKFVPRPWQLNEQLWLDAIRRAASSAPAHIDRRRAWNELHRTDRVPDVDALDTPIHPLMKRPHPLKGRPYTRPPGPAADRTGFHSHAIGRPRPSTPPPAPRRRTTNDTTHQ